MIYPAYIPAKRCQFGGNIRGGLRTLGPLGVGRKMRVSEPVVLAHDLFGGSGNLHGRTLDTVSPGNNWIVDGGAFDVTSGFARNTGALPAAPRWTATFDPLVAPSSATIRTTATITPRDNASGNPGVIIRFTDRASRFFIVQLHQSSGEARLTEWDGSAFVTRDADTAFTWVAGRQITIVVTDDGATMAAELTDSGGTYTLSYASSLSNGNSKTGIIAIADDLQEFHDIKVERL